MSASLWSMPDAFHPPLTGDAEAEVVVIGAGVTGLSMAVLLAEQGHDVLVLEARALGAGTTGGTTAHVTEALDTRYVALEEQLGREGAALMGEASRQALDQVARFVEHYSLDCGYQRLTGFLYTESAAEQDALSAEQQAAERAGCQTSLLPRAPLGFPTAAAVAFANQVQVNPDAYLRGLLRAALTLKVRFCEQARVVSVSEHETCLVELENGAKVRSKVVCIATHVPLSRVTLQLKLVHSMSSVVALEGSHLEPGLYWDTADPYHYMRNATVGGRQYVLVGGADREVGSAESSPTPLEALEAWVRPRLNDPRVSHRWSAQLIDSTDGLPLIGRDALSSQVFVATGFSGNGFTHGTIAARLALDFVEGRTNSLAQLFAPTRMNLAQVGKAIASAATSAGHVVGDRFRAAARSLEGLGNGQGRVVMQHGEPIAVYKNAAGQLTACSAVCTHLGCVVAFNEAERSWDCPCHGSRFGSNGDVLEGPAVTPLGKRQTPEQHGTDDHEPARIIPQAPP